MYTILLLDDEPLILESLKTIIPWEELDLRCIGTGTDGVQGIELIEKYEPDIVISDIVMPGKNGLEVAAYCKGRKGCRLIIISAYSDFAYAQKAMAYGVRHYVLKPIARESLVTAIRECIKDLGDEREWEGIQTRLTEDARELAVSSLLFRIACYGHTLSDVEREMITAFQKFPTAGVVIGIKFYDIQTPEEGSKQILSAGGEYIKAIFDENGYETSWGNSDVMLIFLCFFQKGQRPKEAREKIIRLMDGNISGMDARFGMPVAAVSDYFLDLTDIHERYGQCMEWLDHAFFRQSSCVITAENRSSIHIYEPDTERLLHHMRHGNQEEMDGEFDRWRRWVSHLDSQESAMYALRELYRKAALSATKIGMSEKPQIRSRVPVQFESCRTILLRTKAYLDGICGYAASNRTVVARIKLMVEQSYMDETFSLTTIAERLDMNPSYISRLFKKELSENFSNYILNRRMKQAKFLLSTTDLKIQDVASQCGFSEVHYFGQVFKKETGYSPKEYRSQHEKQE